MTNRPKNGVAVAEPETAETETVAPAAPATSRTITSAEQAAGALRDQIRKTYLSAAELRSSAGLTAGECESVESVMRRQLESIAELDAIVEARKAARGGAAS